MKLSKKLIAIVMTFVATISISTLNAYAFDISTYATAAPSGSTGEWVSSAVDKSVTASTSDANGANIYFYYKPKTLKSLSSLFKANSGRTLEIWAMEDDPTGDDHFKTYSGTFSGRTLTKIQLKKTNISGSIEPNANVELYVKQRVGKINGDKTSKYSSLYSFYWTNYKQ